MIHPSAVIHPRAKLHGHVSVAPFAVIDEDVSIDAGCCIGPHVHLTGRAQIGKENVFHAGCVIGDAPQDLQYKGAPTRVVIGDRNTFREHVTVHRSTRTEEDTVIGSDNLLMAHCHVGHNGHLGNGVIIANGAMLGGHVTVEDRAFISGNCMLHQFVRIGTLALMQGGSGVSKDLPPYTIATGNNRICGLNVVGLRRAGFSAEQRLELKRLYHALFRGGKPLRESLAEAQKCFDTVHARVLLDFIAASKRGVCTDTGRGGAEDEEQ